MKTLSTILIALLALAATADNKSKPATTVGTLSPHDARRAIEKQAKAVVESLKKKNWNAIATKIHPEKGLCVSAYPEACRGSLSRGEWKKITASNESRIWGETDGSGEPLKMSFSDYYQKFLYDRDYANSPEIKFNEFIHRGGNLFDPLEARPGSILVEYHFPAAAEAPSDWTSLRLVFERKGEQWYLSWLQHDGWTI